MSHTKTTTTHPPPVTATPEDELRFSRAAMQALSHRFGHPPTSLHHPLAAPLPSGQRPRMHLIFGVPCTGKTRLSSQLVRKCRRGATINLDYDKASFDDPTFMLMQKAMTPGFVGHADVLGGMTTNISQIWDDVFHAAVTAALTHGYDIIIHCGHPSLMTAVGPLVYNTANKWELYAHFTVYPSAFPKACLDHRTRTLTGIQQVHPPVHRAVLEQAGASFNMLQDVYTYMVKQTPRVFFYFLETNQHVLHTQARVSVDRRTKTLVVHPPYKRKTLGRKKRLVKR